MQLMKSINSIIYSSNSIKYLLCVSIWYWSWKMKQDVAVATLEPTI